ncbi:MAG: hypothetical protein FJ030_16405 [Chloroflexi bacterium]|nr:hypothetical protein [Chloroflexota bacterium]
MSEQSVNEIVGRLAGITLPEMARFESALATTLKQTEENPKWVFYGFALKDGPFAAGELRLSKAGNKALLALSAREESPIVEDDLDLSQWGDVRDIDANPRIPPEGADAYVYGIQGVQVSFQFTHNSRRLRSVVLEWTGAAPS